MLKLTHLSLWITLVRSGAKEDFPESNLKDVQAEILSDGTLYVTFVKSLVPQDSKDVALGIAYIFMAKTCQKKPLFQALLEDCFIS